MAESDDLTLEKLKISERLSKLEIQNTELQVILISEVGGRGTKGNINRHLEEIRDEIKSLKSDLEGELISIKKTIADHSTWIDLIRGALLVIVVLILPLMFQVSSAWVGSLFK